MAKVTSKLQLTIPKALAEKCGIRPGHELALIPTGDFIRMVHQTPPRPEMTNRERLRLFDQMLERQRRRERSRPKAGRAEGKAQRDRGWKREDLYTRGSPR